MVSAFRLQGSPVMLQRLQDCSHLRGFVGQLRSELTLHFEILVLLRYKHKGAEYSMLRMHAFMPFLNRFLHRIKSAFKGSSGIIMETKVKPFKSS